MIDLSDNLKILPFVLTENQEIYSELSKGVLFEKIDFYHTFVIMLFRKESEINKILCEGKD